MTTYECSLCGFSRGIKGYVSQHINRSKSCKDATLIEVIVPVSCEICSKQFDNDNLLSIHKKSCVEKKALVKVEYADPELVSSKIDNITMLVRSLMDQNEELKRTNKEILKRLEKLEKTNKDPYDEVDHEDSICEYFVNEGPTVISYEQVCDFLQISSEDRRASMKINVLVNGSVQNAMMSVASIRADGKIYHFDLKNRKKGDGLVSELRISSEQTCEEVAKFFHRTKEILCCAGHKAYFS